jgi:hypothetical protein
VEGLFCFNLKLLQWLPPVATINTPLILNHNFNVKQFLVMAEFANPYEVLSNQIKDVRSLVLDLRKNQVPTIGTPEAPDRYVSGDEAQKLLGNVSGVTLWEWRKKQIITGYRIGSKVMYKYSELMNCGKMIVK